MQTVNKVLLLIIVAGGLFYWWSKEQSSAEYDRQVGALATTLDRRFVSPATPAAQAEAMFLRAMVILSDYRTLLARGRIRTGEETYLKDVLAAAGFTSDAEISLIAKSLQANLGICQQMKIIPEPEGTQALLTGQAPVIRAGSFKGDTLVIGRRLSAVLAPDLANHPANYAFIPASASALVWPYTLSDDTLRAAAEFKTRGLLDPKTAAELQQRADQMKTIKP
jgi:hypothetical protein